jgi:glycerol-3-phosphate O-acyltransferase
MAVAEKVGQEKPSSISRKSAGAKNPSRKKNLSRKEKLELIRKANQLLENVWDKIYDSHHQHSLEADRCL